MKSKKCWAVDASGAVGHGSRFIADTAIERLIGVSNKALEYRTAQEQQLGYGWANGAAGCKHCEAKKLGDVTSLNLTMLQAGVTPDNGQTFNLNVIPASARAGFDIRIATDTPPAVRIVKRWPTSSEPAVARPDRPPLEPRPAGG